MNYLAAGACNYSDPAGTLWPLDQIVADTQFYVRDAVIHYIADVTPPAISPEIEGRVVFPTPFDFSGFLFPMRDTKPWFRAPAGSTVPVSFNLGADFGMNVLMPGYPRVTGCGHRVRGEGPGRAQEPLGDYTFLWQTNPTWAGKCRQLVFDFVDGSSADRSGDIHRLITIEP